MPVFPTAGVGANPAQKDSELELFERRLQRSQWADCDRRNAAELNWRTYTGDPWPAGVKSEIETRDHTPAVNFNYTLVAVETLVGDQITNRREIQFRAIDSSGHDAAAAMWMGRVVRKIYSRCNGHRAESRGILEQLVTGMGWVHVYVDRSAMPPEIKLGWVPEARAWSDPDSIEDSGADSKFQIIRSLWDKEDALARWPSSKKAIESAAGHNTASPHPRRSEVAYAQHGEGSQEPSRGDTVEVYEYLFKKHEPFVSYMLTPEDRDLKELPRDEFYKLFHEEDMVVYSPTGAKGTVTKRVTSAAYAKLVKRNPTGYVVIQQEPASMPYQHREFPKPVVYVSTVLRGADGGQDHWLSKPERRDSGLFNYIQIPGFWMYDQASGAVKYFGLVQVIQQIQLLIAKTLTQTIQLITRAAKGGGFIASGLLANPRDFEDTQGQVGKYHLLKQGLTPDQIAAGIVHNPSPQFPPFHAHVLDLCTSAIPEVTAVSKYLSGTEVRERSNVLVSNLQGKSKTTLARLYDAPENARIMVGRVIMSFVKEYMPEWYLDKILGDDGEVENVTYQIPDMEQQGQPGQQGQQVPAQAADFISAQVGQTYVKIQKGQPDELRMKIASPGSILKKSDLARYDLSPDTGDASVNEKQAVMSVMGQVMETVLQSGDQVASREIMPIFFRNLPGLPGAKGTEIAEKLEAAYEAEDNAASMEGVLLAAEQMTPEDQQLLIQSLTQMLSQVTQGAQQ